MFNTDRLYGIYRQATNTQFSIVKTDSKHDKLEEEYRLIRTQLSYLIDNLYTIKDSEHGGPALKTIKEHYHKLKGTVPKSEGKDLSDNMYDIGSSVFHNLGVAYSNKNTKKICDELKKFYADLSEGKHNFNKKVTVIIEDLKYLQKESEDLDNLRTKMKNIQFDAENKALKLKKQSPDMKYENDPGFKSKKTEFENLQETVKERMQKYIEDGKHEKCLKEIIEAHKIHFKTAVSDLK